MGFRRINASTFLGSSKTCPLRSPIWFRPKRGESHASGSPSDWKHSRILVCGRRVVADVRRSGRCARPRCRGRDACVGADRGRILTDSQCLVVVPPDRVPPTPLRLPARLQWMRLCWTSISLERWSTRLQSAVGPGHSFPPPIGIRPWSLAPPCRLLSTPPMLHVGCRDAVLVKSLGEHNLRPRPIRTFRSRSRTVQNLGEDKAGNSALPRPHPAFPALLQFSRLAQWPPAPQVSEGLPSSGLGVLVNEELASRSATDAARIAALRASAGGAARAGVARDCSVQQRPLGMARYRTPWALHPRIPAVISGLI